jgi:hypothetical protein
MKYLIRAACLVLYLNVAIRGGELRPSSSAAYLVDSNSMTYLCGRSAPSVRAHPGSSD